MGRMIRSKVIGFHCDRLTCLAMLARNECVIADVREWEQAHIFAGKWMRKGSRRGAIESGDGESLRRRRVIVALSPIASGRARKRVALSAHSLYAEQTPSRPRLCALRRLHFQSHPSRRHASHRLLRPPLLMDIFRAAGNPAAGESHQRMRTVVMRVPRQSAAGRCSLRRADACRAEWRFRQGAARHCRVRAPLPRQHCRLPERKPLPGLPRTAGPD